MGEDFELTRRDFDVPFPPKTPIKCISCARLTNDTSWPGSSLIFTHGAGGTLQADAIVNFIDGFTSLKARPVITCFQGNMNLSSRVKMFSAVLQNSDSIPSQNAQTRPACLGGRSMGARAAVMAATEDTSHLVLASYPLQSGNQVRDQILLDINSHTKVLFISGTKDKMCDIERLNDVRRKMKCKSWMITVQDADHGMNVAPKSATQDMGKMAGALAATWLHECDETATEGDVAWHLEDSKAEWNGWCDATESLSKFDDDKGNMGTESSVPSSSLRKATGGRKRKNPRSQDEADEPTAPKKKQRRKGRS